MCRSSNQLRESPITPETERWVQNIAYDVVKVLLAANADVNQKQPLGGATALFWASQNGHADVVKLLLAAKANVNAKRNDGVTALMVASQNAHADVVTLLHQAGAIQ
jgi:ankyrin repeat protein